MTTTQTTITTDTKIAPTELLSTGDLASLLGLSKSTIIRWIREGKIPARRLGEKLWRIPRREVEGLLAVVQN